MSETYSPDPGTDVQPPYTTAFFVRDETCTGDSSANKYLVTAGFGAESSYQLCDRPRSLFHYGVLRSQSFRR